MYPEILSAKQNGLLPFMKHFRREFYLVGGTAIALQLGHRRSIDFDMFKFTPFRTKKILDRFDANKYHYLVTRRVNNQLNLTVRHVKITFFEYPYPVEAAIDFEKTFRMPDLLTLSAMKAFALGRRAKWKDYVDLYFLLKSNFRIKDIVRKAQLLYGQEFSEKLFRSQLSYHADIDYTETVEFMEGYQIDAGEIKAYLIEKVL
jgi:hypothetical protein